MGTVNIIGNTISGGSTTIGSYTETVYNNFDWPSLQSEVSTLKDKVSDSDPLKPSVTELESAISSRNRESVSSVIAKYAGAFASSTFANVASAGLIALIKSLV